jgi:hypothetical protein
VCSGLRLLENWDNVFCMWHGCEFGGHQTSECNGCNGGSYKDSSMSSSLELVSITLFGKRDFVYVIKLRLLRSSNDKFPYNS